MMMMVVEVVLTAKGWMSGGRGQERQREVMTCAEGARQGSREGPAHMVLVLWCIVVKALLHWWWLVVMGFGLGVVMVTEVGAGVVMVELLAKAGVCPAMLVGEVGPP